MVLDTLQRPFRDLRISITDRCNFRCTYCMPAEIFGNKYKFLPKTALLTFEEITRITNISLGLGVTKVRLTGGEPLVRKEVTSLISSLAHLQGISDLTMTTNGFLLAKNAIALKQAGLNRVSISLDSLDESVFGQMNGLGFSAGKVLEGIAAAEQAGLWPIKINAVIQRGINDHKVVDMARHFKGRGHIVRFIEYMDVGTLNGWQMDQVVSSEEIVAMINQEMPLEPIPNSHIGEVASRYRYKDGDGEIGVISSVTNPFCGNCTRLRLSPEGRLVTCLFSSVGKDLRKPMRAGATDEDLASIIIGTWKNRKDRYSEIRTSLSDPIKKVEMYHIGG